MGGFRRSFFTVTVAFFCLQGPVAIAEPEGAGQTDFDFYALSLSWSPSYCAIEGEDANRQQCGADRSDAFIVHGLWPQNENDYPEYCASREPDRVPDGLVARYLDLMPSAGLIGHQWRKHGSCSGMSQEDYLRAVRTARERVTVPAEFRNSDQPTMVDPDEVEAAFIAANPGLEAKAIAVTCDRRYLREVRICMTKDLQFRPCPAIDDDQCGMDEALMPPSGG